MCGDGLLEDRGIEIRRDLLSVDSDDAITRIRPAWMAGAAAREGRTSIPDPPERWLTATVKPARAAPLWV